MSTLAEMLTTRAPLPPGLLTAVVRWLPTHVNTGARLLAPLIAARPEASADDLIAVMATVRDFAVAKVLATHTLTIDQVWTLLAALGDSSGHRDILTGVLTDDLVTALLADDAPIDGAAFVARSARPAWALAGLTRVVTLLNAQPRRNGTIARETIRIAAGNDCLRAHLPALLCTVTDAKTLKYAAQLRFLNPDLIAHLQTHPAARGLPAADYRALRQALPTARMQEAERAAIDDVVRAMPADTDWDALVTIATAMATGTTAGNLRTAVDAIAGPQG